MLSAADPKRTFLQFVEPKHFPAEFVTSIENFRVRGSSAKVNLALSELPQFTSLPGEGPLHRGSISISPSIDYLERAYDDAKYGQISKRPYVDILIPSMIDPYMAPPGQHVMSCFVQYAPYDLDGGWDDGSEGFAQARREALGEVVLSTIEQYAPNIRRAIVGIQVITPMDIEHIAGITGGNIFHGELLLHQVFFLRPAPQWADFRTPLPGYYFGAAGAHPGGGVMGAAGMLAAKEMLKDWNQSVRAEKQETRIQVRATMRGWTCILSPFKCAIPQATLDDLTRAPQAYPLARRSRRRRLALRSKSRLI